MLDKRLPTSATFHATLAVPRAATGDGCRRAQKESFDGGATALMTMWIDPTVALSLGNDNDLASGARQAVAAGFLRTRTDGTGGSTLGWEFACTSEQAIRIRVTLCMLATREPDPEARDRLLRAERAIANAMVLGGALEQPCSGA